MTFEQKMKTFTTLAILAFAAQVFGDDGIEFQTAGDSGVGILELNKRNRAVLKISESSYILLELIDSSRESDWESYTEACSVNWTSITPDSIQTGTAKRSMRFTQKQSGQSIMTSPVLGEYDSTLSVGGIIIGWAYDSRKAVIISLPPAIKFATTEVEQPEALKP